MEELIKKISTKSLEELEKAQKAPFPFYYKEVFDSIAKEEGVLKELNPKLLCLEPDFNEKLIEKTHNTVKDVKQTSTSIKNSSEDMLEVINIVNAEELKQKVKNFSSTLIENVNKMSDRINELEKELDKAYKDLLIDPLTKAYNRKALDKKLKEILQKGKNKKLDLCVAVIDVDDFKTINDTYGHLIGDFVLIKLVQIIKKLIRTSDNIFRYGGDEFNRINIDTAGKSVERILNKVRKTKLKYKDYIIENSISIGLTPHHKGDSMETIIKRADEALYMAKKAKNIYKVIL